MTIITDISFDHAEILGPTLADIAGEKAGIIKPDTPTVAGLLVPEAMRVIRKTCRERHSELVRLRKSDYTLDRRRGRLDFHAPQLNLKGLHPSLSGSHQLTNAALVLKALSHLRGFKLTKKAVKEGIESVVWAGRFQVVHPGDGTPTVVLDVGHNPGGAAAFARAFTERFPGRKARFILGLVKKKDHQQIVDSLSKVAELFWLVPMNTKRTIDVRQLIETIDWHRVPVGRSARLDTGWRKVLKMSRPEDIIAVVGSHYLVGEYLSKYPG